MSNMSQTQWIHDRVRMGWMSPEDGALLLMLHDEVTRRRRRRAFWSGFWGGVTLGPLWRRLGLLGPRRARK